MSSTARRRLAAGAAGFAAVALVGVPASALATSPQSSAYVVSANAFGAFAAIAPTPTSSYTPGGTTTLAGLNVGPIATSDTLTATTAGDPTSGDSSAAATVEDLDVNAIAASISLTGVNSTCQATPTGNTGSGTITAGTVTILGIPYALTAGAGANTTINLPADLPVISVILNGQTTDGNGGIIVNAVEIKVLSGNGADIVIGHVQCDAAPATVATPMVNPGVGGGALALAAVGSVAYVRRRNRGTETEVV